ncbi:phospholipase D-like domain-containing protein [Achromobacter aegrifaciens]|uniref:phospholipase D-like domain-containing protein n=1 Tax=Achromobacter aegrifaciens TaxID=1287736 RepID=UPI0028ABD593|nr:phospholipase D-like domain-containing protein [Achromobacter aegrifaciens]
MDKLDIDQYTAQIVPDTMTTVSGQYFDLNQPFAMPRYGNRCESYITGRDYMAAVAAAIRGAQSFIMIADWQMDYDVELERRGEDGHPGRLSSLLADAIQRGVHVRILLYDSISAFLDTHDDTTQDMLHGLPKGKGSIRVMLQYPNAGRIANTLFSHHQKFVLVDGKKAFLGGIDLAYGRWETPSFNVVIDPSVHVLNDAYNMQLVPARKPTQDELTLTREHEGRPGFEPPIGGVLLDPLRQPREPWQDVAMKVEGPAAFDVFLNFVLRWNSFARRDTNVFDPMMDAGWFERARGAEHLLDPQVRGSGNATVQICRSASSKQLQDELKLWGDSFRYVNDDWKVPNTKRRKIIQAARAHWAANHQTSIRDAMINCIRSAQAYIYIENQFFISDCGRDQTGGNTSPGTNAIIPELANAIGSAIFADRPFHVWLVLPEHPEGLMEQDVTSSQTWWALQGVKRAENSLVHRINAMLYAKHSKLRNVTRRAESNADIDVALATWGMMNEWRKYLTVLNLRNYGATRLGVLTEMVYVHSKLTIVDDAVAVIGSANINDRSLNGNGDTELAAVVADDEGAAMTEVGAGISVVTRKFARDLRMNLWRKHLGMMVESGSTGVQKEGRAPQGINIERPLEPESIQALQRLGRTNREAYNTVFLHTPRNSFRKLLDGRKAFPPIYKQVKKYEVNGVPIGNVGPDGKLRDGYILVDGPPTGEYDFTKLPDLRPEFMSGTEHGTERAIAHLRSQVKGFFVEMPLEWGAGESETPKSPKGIDTSIAQTDRMPQRESLENRKEEKVT